MTRRTNFDPRWARHGESVVVVADGGRARIFRRLGARYAPQLLEVAHLERPNAHVMRHGAQSDYDPHAVEVQRFARQVGMRLIDLGRHTRIDELVLIAEPRFLGVLRRELPELLQQRVRREVPRDLTAASPQPIAQAAFSLPAASPSGSA